MIQVYRFHDLVAINPPEGDTFYLLPSEATLLSAVLMRMSSDCLAKKLVDSTVVGTIQINATGSIGQGDAS